MQKYTFSLKETIQNNTFPKIKSNKNTLFLIYEILKNTLFQTVVMIYL